MTSIIMRENPLFIRNNFTTVGKYDLPLVKKENISLESCSLISYSDTCSRENEANKTKGVHFFIDDYRFNGIYDHPDKSLNKLSQYAFLLSPDYSTYSDMNIWRQIESVAKNRWVGAYWQSKGLNVIPTISWSNSRSYDFCFDGVEKNSIVAIGMIGCKKNKVNFMRGYDAMLDKICPSKVLVFGDPFKEMEGSIVHIDYLSSRKVVR